MIYLLNEILGLNEERRTPKTLVLLTLSILLLGLIGILKAYIVFIVLYTILFAYCLVKLVIKTHVLYVSTLFLILAEVVHQVDYFFTGGSNLNILSWILLGVAIIINIAVFAVAIIKSYQKKEYSEFILFVMFNLLIVGLIFLITKTYTLSYNSINGGSFSTPTAHFVFKFLSFVAFFFVVLLVDKLLHKSDQDHSLKDQQAESKKIVDSD